MLYIWMLKKQVCSFVTKRTKSFAGGQNLSRGWLAALLNRTCMPARFNMRMFAAEKQRLVADGDFDLRGEEGNAEEGLDQEDDGPRGGDDGEANKG